MGTQVHDGLSGWGVWLDRSDCVGFEAGGSPDIAGRVHQYIGYIGELTTDSWHHAVLSREGMGIDNFKIYVDGVLIETGTLDVFVDNNYPLRIGRSYEEYHRPIYFSGLVDEVRIYERALTTEEVAVLADPTPPEPVEVVEDLVVLVTIVNDDNGIMNSTLEAKLNGALNTLDDVNENNDIAAINTLENFIDAVIRQRDRGDIPPLDAQDLIDAAQYTINLLTSTIHH